MGKRLPTTPRSQVRSALRRLWLRSRERAAALRRDKYTCQLCDRKQSRAKGREVYVEVNHLELIEWDNILAYIYKHLLVEPRLLEVLCKPCHEAETKRQRGLK